MLTEFQSRFSFLARIVAAGGIALVAICGVAWADDPAPPASPPVRPKPLSNAVLKGIDYLVQQQLSNGAWGQGGGWRVNQEARAKVESTDPPDVANTSLAILAFLRAGSTPKGGPHSKQVYMAAEFVIDQVGKSDRKSLYVTEVRGSQVQSKMGRYVDTFLASLALAELKGHMPDDQSEKELGAALVKLVAKIESNQQADGSFANNYGWATVLSQGLANKGLTRVAQCGVAVNDLSIKRIQDQITNNYDAKAQTFKAAENTNPSRLFSEQSKGSRGGSRYEQSLNNSSDAGIPIYQASSNWTNTADVLNTLRLVEKQSRTLLRTKAAADEDRKRADELLKRLAAAERLHEESTRGVLKQLQSPAFVQGFGSFGGEEFLSFLNISEALLIRGGDEFKNWDEAVTRMLTRLQDRDGSWSGQHCVTGKTFCTAAALLVLTADRTPTLAR